VTVVISLHYVVFMRQTTKRLLLSFFTNDCRPTRLRPIPTKQECKIKITKTLAKFYGMLEYRAVNLTFSLYKISKAIFMLDVSALYIAHK